MKPEFCTMVKNLGCFEYDDYDIEARLGPREIRPMTWIREGDIFYEGEWLRNTDIPHGRFVALKMNTKGDAGKLLC